MLAYSVPSKLVSLIKSYCAETKACVHNYGKELCLLELKFEVKQRCTLSPVLLNFAVDWVVQRVANGYQNVHVPTECYTENYECVMFEENLKTFQSTPERVNEYASETGLEISTTKIKMFVIPESTVNRPYN